VNMRHIGRLFLMVVMGVLVLNVAAFATAKDEIVVVHIGQITSIDPSFANWSSNSNTVYSAVYETFEGQWLDH